MSEENDIIQASLLESDEKELFSFLREYCPDVDKLFGGCEEISRVKDYISTFLCNRYIAVKGQVQSGKTAFMICASMLVLLTGMDVVIVLRNSNSDLSQIYSRLELFRQELASRFGKSFQLTTSKKPKPNPAPQIVLALANGISLEKVLGITTKSYLLIVDEADHIDSGTQTRKSVVLPMLKDQAHCVIGVSATVMDLLGKEELLPKDLILLSPPDNYKGIPHILESTEYIPPGAVYSSKVDSKLEENDPYLLEWVEDLLQQPVRELSDGTPHPVIALITICDTVNPCLNMALKMASHFGNRVRVVDHHADGILIRHGKFEDETKDPISVVLQELKDTNPRLPVIIFAGDIAGRGVSYVSRDYKWHLTHQRLIVSKSCPEPELMQKVRLCGVYKDDLPLTLVSTTDIIADLRKAYFKQEELVGKVREAADSFQGKCRDFFKEVIFEKEKMSGRHTTKDPKARPELQLVDFAVGWDYYKERRDEDEQSLPEEYPKKEFERLTGKMFPKWASDEGATHISRFMVDLDPQKEYTHSEMLELCRQSGVGNKNLKNLTVPSNHGKSNGYGMILQVQNNRYRLYPVLKEAFEAFF
jgi:hypothetical protein